MRKFLKGKINIVFAIVLIVGIVAAFNHSLFAANLTDNEVRELNNATPGTFKTQLGTKLRGPLTYDTLDVAATSTASASLTAAYQAYIYNSAGTTVGNAYGLADGYSNQQVTFILNTDGGGDIIVSPLTKIGYSNITLNDAKDSCTLKWTDSQHGWVIVGNNACTVN